MGEKVKKREREKEVRIKCLDVFKQNRARAPKRKLSEKKADCECWQRAMRGA